MSSRIRSTFLSFKKYTRFLRENRSVEKWGEGNGPVVFFSPGPNLSSAALRKNNSSSHSKYLDKCAQT